jgi:UDP-N-acetylglucosamine 2-epimerase
VDNLREEGIAERARLVGDLMLDACLSTASRGGDDRLEDLGVRRGEYAFATVHRAENTDHPSRLSSILRGLGRVGRPVLLPLHPRTRNALERFGIDLPENVLATGPTSYLTTAALIRAAVAVYTDSGGLQREAFFLGTRCITLRDETEWTETVDAGWNVLVGADEDAIASAGTSLARAPAERDLEAWGGGRAGERIREALEGLGSSMSI